MFTSKTETRDHLPVWDNENGMIIACLNRIEANPCLCNLDISVVGVLEAWLPEEKRALFPIAGPKGKQVHRAEYRIIATYHQTVVSYEFIIPQSGEAKSEADWTDDPIRCSAILEPDSVFQYGLGQGHAEQASKEDGMDIDEDMPLVLRRPRGKYITAG